jgi:DMSO/TMAO reductase YedYZ heme-binding membrane subunit
MYYVSIENKVHYIIESKATSLVICLELHCLVPLLCIVTDLLKALLGNSPVSTFQRTCHSTVLWKCFLCVRAWTVPIQCMRGDVTQQCVGITCYVFSVIHSDVT